MTEAATPRPRITFITLGVSSLERALAFYRDGLGFATSGIVGSGHEHGAVVFIQCEGGLKLALWPLSSLAAESGAEVSHSGRPNMSVAQNLGSEAEVDAVMARAAAAGARITGPARPTFYGGYAGYFQDPDGHLWELAFNPGFEALG